mmetsp:Transcript_65520/g.147839  ORF Transcript_65520/g.147839 Transcript_65520/m.147839 type:complete len:316 (+) Transcript_65520:158-1105(+)
MPNGPEVPDWATGPDRPGITPPQEPPRLILNDPFEPTFFPLVLNFCILSLCVSYASVGLPESEFAGTPACASHAGRFFSLSLVSLRRAIMHPCSPLQSVSGLTACARFGEGPLTRGGRWRPALPCLTLPPLSHLLPWQPCPGPDADRAPPSAPPPSKPAQDMRVSPSAAATPLAPWPAPWPAPPFLPKTPWKTARRWTSAFIASAAPPGGASRRQTRPRGSAPSGQYRDGTWRTPEGHSVAPRLPGSAAPFRPHAGGTCASPGSFWAHGAELPPSSEPPPVWSASSSASSEAGVKTSAAPSSPLRVTRGTTSTTR